MHGMRRFSVLMLGLPLLLLALAVPVGAAEDAAPGDDGGKQDPSPVIRLRTISLSLAAEAAGYAVGTGSGDAPLQYEAEFESGGMNVQHGDHHDTEEDGDV